MREFIWMDVDAAAVRIDVPLASEPPQAAPLLEGDGGYLAVFAIAEPARAWRRRLSLLSEEERVRAERLVDETRRARFVACRSVLREILGMATGAAVTIVTAPGGKPVLAGGGLSFSTAHSGDVAAIVLRARGAVGVDIESALEVADPEGVARRWLGEEAACAVAGAGNARASTFREAWVRREAMAKAHGAGMGRLAGASLADHAAIPFTAGGQFVGAVAFGPV